MLKLALIGSDIDSSLSPQIFKWLGEKSKTEVRYDLVKIPNESELKDSLQRLIDCGYKGINVTRPFKSSVLHFLEYSDLDVVRSVGAQIGAANWVDFEKKRVGNTDFMAIESLLASYAPKSAVIYGCGGAARAAILALKNLGCRRIEIANRSSVKGLCQEFDLPAYNGAAADWMIQASPETELNAQLSQILKTTRVGVFEMVYRPKHTGLVLAAAEHSLIVILGLKMLVRQALLGWAQWTSQNIPQSWEQDLAKELESKC